MNRKLFFSGVLVIMAVMMVALVPGVSSSKENAGVLSGEGIRFVEENWAKAKAEAKKQNKLIFLDAYTSWCGPCKMLKRNTFPDKEAGEFFNKNFINVALDMEKGDGPAVAQTYQVNAYPTLIITDADGNLVTYTRGYIDAKQLIEFGKHGLSKSTK